MVFHALDEKGEINGVVANCLRKSDSVRFQKFVPTIHEINNLQHCRFTDRVLRTIGTLDEVEARTKFDDRTNFVTAFECRRPESSQHGISPLVRYPNEFFLKQARARVHQSNPR